VEGEVSSVADFGAFVRLAEGIEGLIYTGELAATPVANPSDVVKEGDRVKAIVTRVDPNEQKISLSIKAIHDQQTRQALAEQAAQQAKSQRSTLGDLLAEKLGRKGEE
jgi:small subunit ribosomal protein S1